MARRAGNLPIYIGRLPAAALLHALLHTTYTTCSSGATACWRKRTAAALTPTGPPLTATLSSSHILAEFCCMRSLLLTQLLI